MPVALPIREDVSPTELRTLARRERKGRVAGMDRQALRDAVVRYNAQGVAGLHDRPSRGWSEWLSEDEQATIKAIILTGPDVARRGCVEWTLPILCEVVIAERFGKTLHPASLSRIRCTGARSPCRPFVRPKLQNVFSPFDTILWTFALQQ